MAKKKAEKENFTEGPIIKGGDNGPPQTVPLYPPTAENLRPPKPDPLAALTIAQLEAFRQQAVFELCAVHNTIHTLNLKGEQAATFLAPAEANHKALQEAIIKRQEG